MDSDLPLIEMAGEDDSLLQYVPDSNETFSKSPLNYFTCSPLYPPRSYIKSLKGSIDIEEPCSSSSKGSNNKENMISNNLEVPKLGLEPMQMKRRKRGGGYNLRKSLAWDRAFFTDEGILDPLELSLVTGINGNTCGERMAAISEDGNQSFSADTKCTNDSEDTQAFEEASRKELLDKIHTLKGKKEKAGCSVGNHGLLHDRVTRKVLSIHGPNRNGSKVDGCPGPLAASSLKRPAISKTVKTAKQESKLPKPPVSKPGPCFSATTKGSVTASQMRHNLIPKPTVNVPKNVGLKSSLKNVKVSQSKARTGLGSVCLPAKDPAQNTVRNLTDTSSKAASSTKSRSLQVGKANSGSEMIPDRLQLSEIQEESAPLAAKDLAQHTTRNLTNTLPEAARPTNSGPSQFQRASGDLMISDGWHPCESQEGSATLATSRSKYHFTTGVYPAKIEPAKSSGLRLPSPSLRFFDQKIASESVLMFQKNAQQYNTNLDSNRKDSELRPPTIPGRTPIKDYDITESIFSAVLTSSRQCSAPPIIGAHYGSTQLSPSPNYIMSTTSGVPDLKINPNLEIRNAQKVDMNMQYECRSSEHKAHEVIEQEQTILRHVENIEMEKIAWKVDGKVKVSDNQVHLESWPTEQLGEGNGASINSAENVGYDKVGVGTFQLMVQDNNERAALVPGTQGKLVHQNNEDKLQNYSAISKSTPGSIQHQEQNYLITVDSNTEFMQDLAQTSREQVDTEKSDVPKVDPASHLNGGCVEAKDQVSTVSGESQKDRTGKIGDDLTAPKDAGPGMKNYHVVLQHEKIEQEIRVANGVDEIYKRLPIGDDTRCHIDASCLETKQRISITCGESMKDEVGNGGNADARDKRLPVGDDTRCDIDTSCLETQGRISITCGESLKDEVGNGGNVDARDLKCTGTTLGIPFKNSDTEQGNDDADSVNTFSSRSPLRDAGTQAPYDNLSAEGWFHTNPTTFIKNKAQLEDSGTSDQAAKCIEVTTLCLSVALNSHSPCEGWSVDCIVPVESSSLEKPPCDDATESIDYVVQESRLNNSRAIYMDVPGQTQDGGVDVDLIPGQPHAEVPEGFREFAPLIDEHNHSSHPHLRPEVELISGTASVGSDAYLETESVLQAAQSAGTCLNSLAMEGLDLPLVTSVAEFETHEESCSQKSWELGASTGNFSEKSMVTEESQHSLCNIFDASPTVQGRIDGSETSDSQFLSAYLTLEDAGAVGNFSKSHVEDVQVQLLDGDILVGSCSRFTSVVHDHSLQHVDHSDIFEELPEFSNTGIQVEQYEVHECDPKGSKIIVHAPPVTQEVGFDCDDDGQLCLEYATSGSAVVDSIAEHDENYRDRRLARNTECCGVALYPELELEGKDQIVGVGTTCMEYCSASEEEESCSYPRKVDVSMLEEKATLHGPFLDIGRVMTDNCQLCTKDSLSPEKIANLEKPDNVLDSAILIRDQSINHGSDLKSSNASAQIIPTVHENVFDLGGDDQPYMDNEPQGFVGIMPSVETHEYFTSGQTGHDLKSSSQDPSEFNSNSLASQHPATDVKTKSTTFCSVTTESCSVTAELCSVAGGKSLLTSSEFRIGVDGSKKNLGEEAGTKIFEEGNSPMLGDFHHELDGGSGLKMDKDATVLIKRSNNIVRQDNPLVIHPPNAVPFSDEWLAAMEAAGEEILTMKCGAVQHSPPDKSLPEPGPWSPVKKKANQIGPYDCTKYTNTMPASPQ